MAPVVAIDLPLVGNGSLTFVAGQPYSCCAELRQLSYVSLYSCSCLATNAMLLQVVRATIVRPSQDKFKKKLEAAAVASFHVRRTLIVRAS